MQAALPDSKEALSSDHKDYETILKSWQAIIKATEIRSRETRTTEVQRRIGQLYLIVNAIAERKKGAVKTMRQAIDTALAPIVQIVSEESEKLNAIHTRGLLQPLIQGKRESALEALKKLSVEVEGLKYTHSLRLKLREFSAYRALEVQVGKFIEEHFKKFFSVFVDKPATYSWRSPSSA